MSKYEEGYLYRGDIYKIENKKRVLIDRSASILYNEELDTFYLFNSKANRCLISLIMDRDKLSESEVLEYRKIFLEGNYPYKNEGLEGDTFIDSDSIRLDEIELKNGKNKNSRR